MVGYAFFSRIDAQLTLAALDMAVRREKPDSGLMFRSDRGVQYAAAAYRERLASVLRNWTDPALMFLQTDKSP